MSYSITGIQANSADFAFHSTDYASGGSIHSPLTQTTVDHDTTKLPGTLAVQGAVPDKFKVAATPHTAAPVDTVTLSAADKVRQLRQQGAGETQIAAALNLPLKEVETDLHLQTQPQQHFSFTVAPVSAPLSTSAVATTGQTVSTNA